MRHVFQTKTVLHRTTCSNVLADHVSESCHEQVPWLACGACPAWGRWASGRGRCGEGGSSVIGSTDSAAIDCISYESCQQL